MILRGPLLSDAERAAGDGKAEPVADNLRCVSEKPNTSLTEMTGVGGCCGGGACVFDGIRIFKPDVESASEVLSCC